MTSPFVLTRSAARDLDEILEYVLEHSGTSRARHRAESVTQGRDVDQ